MTDTTYDNSTELDPRIAARLKRDAKGLVAAVIQQYDTREVLMVGYMNDEALRPYADHRPRDLLVPVPSGILAQG